MPLQLKLVSARWIDAIPWCVALVGIAIPHIGSGTVYWLILGLWLLVLVAVALARPLRTADRATRLTVGVGASIALVFLGTLGGLYLVPAMLAWLVIEAWRPRDIPRR